LVVFTLPAFIFIFFSVLYRTLAQRRCWKWQIWCQWRFLEQRICLITQNLEVNQRAFLEIPLALMPFHPFAVKRD
jgi:hypothetical protein